VLHQKYVVVGVVHFAIIPNELYISKAVLDCLVFVVGQVLLDCSEVHGSFDYDGVVDESEGFVVDWLSELEGVLGVEEGLDELYHFFLFFSAHECVAAEVTAGVHAY